MEWWVTGSYPSIKGDLNMFYTLYVYIYISYDALFNFPQLALVQLRFSCLICRYSAVGTLDGDSRPNRHAHAWHLRPNAERFQPSPLPTFKVPIVLCRR